MINKKLREVIKMRGKKGISAQLFGLAGGAIALGVLMFVVVIMSQLTTTVQDQQVTDSVAYNISADALTGFAQFGNWFVILVLILVAIVVISALTLFRFGRGGL